MTLQTVFRLAARPAYDFERAALTSPGTRDLLLVLAYASYWQRVRILLMIYMTTKRAQMRPVRM